MSRLLNTLPIAAVLAFVLGSIELACADGPNETYRQIIAKRAAPQIEGLAERASPEQTGEVATESFWDLLKLRDEPSAAAVPELARILSAHDGSNRIHGFAAAQALFTANRDEARRALDARLLAPGYSVDLAAMYTAHWQMAEPARSRFIDEYLLRNLSKELDVTVEARWQEPQAERRKAADRTNGEKQDQPGRMLAVKVRLQNVSKRTLAINIEQPYQAMSLFIRDPSGVYWRPRQLVVYQPPQPHWLRLSPGDATTYEVTAELKTDAESLAKSKRFYADEGNAAALLETNDVGSVVGEFGTYHLSAMIVRPPLLDEQQKWLETRQNISASEAWTGRAVSAPVKIEIMPSGPQDK